MKKTVIRLAWILPVCLFMCAVILYQRGVYDISFLTRPSVQTDPAADETDPSQTQPDQTEDPSAQQTDPIPDRPNTPSSGDYDAFIYAIRTVEDARSAGYFRTAADYVNGKTIIARVSGGDPLPMLYQNVDGSPVLTVYMGHILYHTEKTVGLLSADGKVLFGGLDGFNLTYLRDPQGRPLFERNGTYYYLKVDSKSIVPVEINPIFAPAVLYGSASKYGVSDGELQVYAVDRPVTVYRDPEGNDITETVQPALEKIGECIEQERRWRLHYYNQLVQQGTATFEDYQSYFAWRAPDLRQAAVRYNVPLPEYTETTEHHYLYGYTDAAGEVVIEAQYAFACAFSGGYAVVANELGVVSVINSEGKTVIDPYEKTLYLEGRENRPAIDGYYLPDVVNTEDNIGMFYFDHGLVRMRRVIYDYYKRDVVLRDDNVLIRTDGSYFTIPSQYNLVAYSDGVLLLEKDGKYGYYDYKTRWIADPVLRDAEPFCEGLAVVRAENGKKGVLNTEGNYVLPAVFDEIFYGTDGLIVTYERAHGWSIFWKMEK